MENDDLKKTIIELEDLNSETEGEKMEMEKKIGDLETKLTLTKQENADAITKVNKILGELKLPINKNLDDYKKDIANLKIKLNDGARIKTKYNQLVKKYNSLVRTNKFRISPKKTKDVDKSPEPTVAELNYTKAKFTAMSVKLLRDVCRINGVGIANTRKET
jgi:chromosome segregation ATPase